jgi:hypothetical protein
MAEREEFIYEYTQKCLNNETALFLGAGMSSSAGLPSWKELFKPLAKELKIDIDATDYQLYDIAQFYANYKSLSELHKRILDEIKCVDDNSEALDELTNIQCSSIWTTNFDKSIENNYYKKGKKTNIISSEANLISADLNKNINIFKMNGDIDSLKNATVTKNDLENYLDSHSMLLSFFKRELIVKTFLFIGYSFTDSLVLSCISELNRIFDNNQPYHYSIMKKEESSDFYSFIKDLENRYHIKTLLIDDFDEIPKILKEINYNTNKYNVFLSGSYRGNDARELDTISKFCYNITYSLYHNKYRIINGYGYKVGYYIAAAATKIMLEENVRSFEKYLLMYPFDEHINSEQKKKHRIFMLSKANVAIFIYGSSNKDSGMYEEFEIAKSDPKKIIIPIGATGGTAKIIYDEVRNDIIRYPYLEKYIDSLGNSNKQNSLIDIVLWL